MDAATVALLNDAVGWFFQHREQIVNVWGLFSTVAVGVLGFTALSDKAATWPVATIMGLGFLIIAVGNGYALYWMYVDLNLSYKLATDIARAARFVQLPMDQPITPLKAMAFHAMLSVVTIGAILIKARKGARRTSAIG